MALPFPGYFDQSTKSKVATLSTSKSSTTANPRPASSALPFRDFSDGKVRHTQHGRLTALPLNTVLKV
jgi:hypothetical protein